MIKNIFGLLLLSVSQIFSFNKMSDCYLLKGIQENSDYKFISIKFLEDDSLENLKEFSHIYCYDKDYGYFLVNSFCVDDLWNENTCQIENYPLKQNKFELQSWEQIFKPRGYTWSTPSIEVRRSPYSLLPVSGSFNLRAKDIIAKYIAEIDYEKDYVKDVSIMPDTILESSICIENQSSNVILSKVDNESKKIDFQSALLKYMKHRKQLQDQLSESVPKFAYDIQHQTATQSNRLITDSILKIIDSTKTNYTQEQIELLENSKILKVWALPPQNYSNKEYQGKLRRPTHKKNRSKTIYPIVLGLAYDTRDNMTYNWIINLGQDISVLFKELEPITIYDKKNGFFKRSKEKVSKLYNNIIKFKNYF